MENQIKKTISELVGCDIKDCKSDAVLRRDLGCDSLDAVEIVMELEDVFDLEIDYVDMVNDDTTVQDIVNYIDNKNNKS